MKFDDFDKNLMVKTVKTLLNVGFRIVYDYTESDEISLLFHPKDYTFGRKVRKINTTLAGEASAAFSLAFILRMYRRRGSIPLKKKRS